MRSRLFFAFIGLLAGLIAAGFGEGLYRAVGLPGAGLPPLPFAPERKITDEALSTDAEVARRLQQAGAKGGDVQVTLSWENENDIDLHVTDPGGTDINYGNRRSRLGGVLDVDANVSPPFTSKPIENVLFPPGASPDGPYQVRVQHYRPNGLVGPTPYRLETRVRNVTRVFTGIVEPRQSVTPARFTLGPNSVQFDGEDPVSTSGPLFRWDGSIIRAYAVPLILLGLLGMLLPVLFTLALRRWRPDLRRTAVPWRVGGLGGLAAGAAGETALLLLGSVGGLALGFPVGWAIAGGLIGLAASRGFERLPRKAAIVVGAFVAALLATLAAQPRADALARISAVGFLGAALGFLIVIERPEKRRPIKRRATEYGRLSVRPLTRTGDVGSLRPRD